MKKQIAFLFLLLQTIFLFAERDVRFHTSSGEVKCVAMERIDSLSFDENELYLIVTLKDGRDSLSVSDLDSISCGVLQKYVGVRYSGETVSVVNPFAFDGVSVAVDGAKLTVVSRAAEEIEYRLSGESDDGAFKIYGSKKFILTLDALRLVNRNGAAINSQCKKRGKINIETGTQNYLADSETYSFTPNEDEKATIFSEGQLIFSGGGELFVDGFYKHGICSDDYIAVENAAITVLSAVTDAFHSNDSILISGGVLSLTAQGDGMDSDGMIRVSGGDVSIQSSGDDVKGIKSSNNVYITDGSVTVKMSGSKAKGVKSAGNLTITGGNVDIAVTGNSLYENGDVSYSVALKCDSIVEISGGNVNLIATGVAGRGISADIDVNISGGRCNIECCGDSDTYNPATGDDEIAASRVLYVSKPTGGLGGGFRPGGQSSSWKSIYLYDENGYMATLSDYVTLDGVQFYYYDFGSKVDGTYYLKSDDYSGYTLQTSSFTGIDGDVYYKISSSYSTSGTKRIYSLSDVTSVYENISGGVAEELFTAVGIKCDGTFLLSAGEHSITMSGTASKGVLTDADCIVSGGSLFIENTGAAVSYNSVSGVDYHSSKCLKSDGIMKLLGGKIKCKAIAAGGKCIVSDGEMVLGRSGEENLLDLSAVTSGTALGTSSSGTGFGGMGGGMNEGFNAAPKAIKGENNVVVNSGKIYVQTAADGGEGIESKASLIINGGYVECNTYDDGMNAVENITINGGYVYCHASNNDGIDSNGTLNINGGIVLSSGASQPEDGFDCDNNAFLITGGLIVGTGGSTGTPTYAEQYYSKLSSVSMSSGCYLTVKDAENNVLFSYKCPNTINGATVLLSSPDFKSSAYSLISGVTTVADETENLFDGVFLIGGTVAGGTSRSFTPSLK